MCGRLEAGALALFFGGDVSSARDRGIRLAGQIALDVVVEDLSRLQVSLVKQVAAHRIAEDGGGCDIQIHDEVAADRVARTRLRGRADRYRAGVGRKREISCDRGAADLVWLSGDRGGGDCNVALDDGPGSNGISSAGNPDTATHGG